MQNIRSRYDYMWEANTQDEDGEAWPDPLSVDFEKVIESTRSMPDSYTLRHPDLKKLWIAYYKASKLVDLDDVIYCLNGIAHVGQLEPEDQIILFDLKSLGQYSFYNLK